MKVHIILPFSRYKNKEIVLNFLEQFKDKVIIHPIEEIQNKSDWPKDWIEPLACPTLPKDWDAVYYKLNYFIKNNLIIDEDYYFVYSDDNLFKPELIDVIYKQSTDVVFLGVKFHPTINLVPIPGNAKSHSISNCGLYNFVLKGHLLKNSEFKNLSYGDGVMMESLYNNTSLSKTYCTDPLYILYNYLDEKWPK